MGTHGRQSNNDVGPEFLPGHISEGRGLATKVYLHPSSGELIKERSVGVGIVEAGAMGCVGQQIVGRHAVDHHGKGDVLGGHAITGIHIQEPRHGYQLDVGVPRKIGGFAHVDGYPVFGVRVQVIKPLRRRQHGTKVGYYGARLRLGPGTVLFRHARRHAPEQSDPQQQAQGRFSNRHVYPSDVAQRPMVTDLPGRGCYCRSSQC